MMYANLKDIQNEGHLDSLYRLFPDDELIAHLLADRIIEQPISKRNFSLLNELIENFYLTKRNMECPKLEKAKSKNRYKIAVLLPFMFDNLESTRRVERNKFVMGLYQGILDAASQLNSQSEYLEIFPYDTRRNPEITKEILDQPELSSMDIIIGPLFPAPSKVANDFVLKIKST